MSSYFHVQLNQLLQGASGLDGELKSDFEKMLETHKKMLEDEYESTLEERVQVCTVEQKDAMSRHFEREKHQIKRDSDKERSELIKDYEKEKTTISMFQHSMNRFVCHVSTSHFPIRYKYLARAKIKLKFSRSSSY